MSKLPRTQPPPDDLEIKPVFRNNDAGTAGNLPAAAPLIYISDDFQPAVGVYIVAAPNASGKTVVTTAIVAWANYNKETPATYYSVFEPRSSFGTRRSSTFAKPLNFLGDVKKVMGPPLKKKLLVFDSATLPMKAYAANYANQATFTGGSQPSDRAFLDALSDLAAENNACIMITLNQSLIPYVADLEGAVEGVITLTKDVRRFKLKDRTSFSSRREKEIVIPIAIVNAALKANFYDDYTGSVIGGNLNAVNRAGMYANRNK